MKNCPTCGAPNDIDAHFCETCGTPLDSQTEESDLFEAAENDMTIMSTAGELRAQHEKTVKVDQAALEDALQQPIEPPPLPISTETPTPTLPNYSSAPEQLQPFDSAPSPVITPDLIEKPGDGGGRKKMMIISASVILGVLAICCCCSSIVAGGLLADPSLFQ